MTDADPTRCGSPGAEAVTRGEIDGLSEHILALTDAIDRLGARIERFASGALVARDAVLVQDAARAAVREAAVDAGSDRVHDAARRTLAGVEVEVHRTGGVGDPVEVRVHYRDHTNLPLVGPLFPDITLRARATMRAER